MSHIPSLLKCLLQKEFRCMVTALETARYVHIILSLLSSYPSLSHLTLPLPSHLVPTPAPGSSKTAPIAASQPPTSCWRRRSCTAGCSEHSSSPTTPSTRSCEGSSLSLTTGSSTTMGCHRGNGAHVTGRYVDVLYMRVPVMARTGVAAPPTHASHMRTYHHTVRMHFLWGKTLLHFLHLEDHLWIFRASVTNCKNGCPFALLSPLY